MIKNGISSIYVDSNNYIEQPDAANFSADSSVYEIQDPIRYYSQNFWTIDGSSIIESNKNDALYRIKHIKDDIYELEANKSKFVEDIINERGVLERKFNKKLWEQFVKNILNNAKSTYYDTFLDFQEPVNFQDVKDTKEPNINFINREFIFNFYSQKYENLLKGRSVDETTIPNIFYLLNDKNLDTRTYEENLFLSLGGLIPDEYVESLFLAKSYNDNIKKYFDLYAEVYLDQNASRVVSEIASRTYNFDINDKKLDDLSTLDYVPFPMYTDIRFSNAAKYSENILNYIKLYEGMNEDLIGFLKDDINNSLDSKFMNKSSTLQEKTLKYYDLKKWINNEIAGMVNEGTADGVRIFVDSSKNYKEVKYTNLINYLKNNIKPKIRKYHEFMKKSCEYDILCYKIEKKLFGYDKTPVQTFWITPNHADVIRFIDTQVKYGTEYYYSVTAFTFVLSNRYTYSKFDYAGNELERINDISQGKYKFKLENNGEYRVLEVPVANFNGIIHETPYTKPVVSFEKSENSLKINIKQSATESYEKFEIIEGDDFKLFEAIKMSQDNKDKDKIRSYIPSDTVPDLQIYKIAKKPTSHLSFQNKLYKTINLANITTFLDNIVPNIKYYYLFRYANKHSIPSNASSIYQIEMKDEDGLLYLDVQEVDLNKGPEKELSKDLKRYLLIRPSMIQTYPKFSIDAKSVNDITLGPKEDQVWNKDFILRLTSKKTNRVIEFNLKSIINRKKD